MKRTIENLMAIIFILAMAAMIIIAVLFSDGKISMGTYLVIQACICVYCMMYVYIGGGSNE